MQYIIIEYWNLDIIIHLEWLNLNSKVIVKSNMAAKNLFPSSTVEMQDSYFPGTVEPSLKVLSHELFYNTPQLRFRQLMLLNYVITVLFTPPPSPGQLYESII